MSEQQEEKAEVVPLDRNRLRSLTVGQNSKSKPDKVTCEIDGQEVQFDVYSLPYKERKEVHQAATKTGYDAEGNPEVDFDQMAYEIELLIRCTYVPETDERLFEQGDKEALLQQNIGPGHWMTKLISAAQEMNRAGN